MGLLVNAIIAVVVIVVALVVSLLWVLGGQSGGGGGFISNLFCKDKAKKMLDDCLNH